MRRSNQLQVSWISTSLHQEKTKGQIGLCYCTATYSIISSHLWDILMRISKILVGIYTTQMYSLCLNPRPWCKSRLMICVCVFLHQMETADVCKMYVKDPFLNRLHDWWVLVCNNKHTDLRQTDRCKVVRLWLMMEERGGGMGKNRRDNSALISLSHSKWLRL